MPNSLKPDYLKTIFQFKNLINTHFGRDKAHMLSLTDLLIMQGIADQQSSVTISQNLHVTKGAISQSINNLAKRGFVTRDVDPDNRRQVLLTLTTAGQDELKVTNEAFDSAFDQFVDEMGAQELTELLALMKRMTAILSVDQ